MSAGQLDLSIEKGATYRKVLIWKDSSKNIIDITGYTARMQIRSSVTAPSFLVELTTENSRITITGAEGKIELYISDTDTSALQGTQGVYDLELISTTNDVIKLLRGNVSMVDEVTK